MKTLQLTHHISAWITIIAAALVVIVGIIWAIMAHNAKKKGKSKSTETPETPETPKTPDSIVVEDEVEAAEDAGVEIPENVVVEAEAEDADDEAAAKAKAEAEDADDEAAAKAKAEAEDADDEAATKAKAEAEAKEKAEAEAKAKAEAEAKAKAEAEAKAKAEAEARLASIQKNHAKIENLAMRYLKYKQEYSETQFQLGIAGRRVKQLEAASAAAAEVAVTADTDAICAEGEYDATLKNKGRVYLAIGKKQRADGADEELARIQAAADEAEILGLTTADEAEAKNEAAKRCATEAAEAVKVKANAKAEYSGRLEELTVLMENIERKLREEYKLNDKEIEELLNPKA